MTESWRKGTTPPESPVEKNGFIQFMSLTSFGGKELFRSLHRDVVAVRDLSPQSKIAATFKPILADESKLAQWDTVMRDLVGQVVSNSDMDPILQVALLRRILDSAVEGSAVLRDVLGPLKNELDKADVDINVPWMNPESDLKAIRERAAHCIRTVRDQFPLPPTKAIDDLRDQIERSVLRTYPTVGWLVKDRQGWRVQPGSTVPKQGELWVVLPVEKGGKMKKLGQLKEGKPTLDVLDSSILTEGRPVFLDRETR